MASLDGFLGKPVALTSNSCDEEFLDTTKVHAVGTSVSKPCFVKCSRRQWLVWSGALTGAAFAGMACQRTQPQPPPSGNAPLAPASTGSAPVAAPITSSASQAPTADPIAATSSTALGTDSPHATHGGTGEAPSIALQPIGEQLPEAQVALVKAALQAFYACEVPVLPRIELPESAYTAPRKRYRAERLLDTLIEKKPANAQRILGLTAVDISTTKGNVADWGILGLATMDGSACVISSFRTRRGAKNDDHAAQRLAKTAVHEIGHTLGLPHCPNHGCLMEDGKGTVFTTDHEYELCTQCRTQLEQAGVALAPPGTEPPWPR